MQVNEEMKDHESNQNADTNKPEPTLNNQTTAEQEAKKKAKLQAAFKKFVAQLKMGCNKQICFNTYCRKNIFSKWFRTSTHFVLLSLI